MGKMKVYELAKELNIQSKEIVSYLQANGVEGKVAQSALDDSAVEMVKKNFGAAKEAPKASAPAEQPKQAAPAEQPKTEAPAEEAKAAAQEAPKKKKRIVIVGNPQHSKSGQSRHNHPA